MSRRERVCRATTDAPNTTPQTGGWERLEIFVLGMIAGLLVYLVITDIMRQITERLP